MSTCCRPLPRGLLRFEEVKTAVNLTQLGLIVYGVLLAVRFSWSVGLLFILQVQCTSHSLLMRSLLIFVVEHLILQIFYTYLMYIEFGIGEWLEQRPFLYAITHQVSNIYGDCSYTLLCVIIINFTPSAVDFCDGHVYW